MTNEEFSAQIVLMVLRIYICVFWIFVSCMWSDQSEFTALFLRFLIRGLVQILFLSNVVNF